MWLVGGRGLTTYLTCHAGPQLVLQLQDGTTISSANEICRLLCVESGRGDLIGTSDPLQGALVDYWLEWEAREVKVGVADSTGLYSS